MSRNKYLSLSSAPSFFLKHGDGQIDVREYVIALSVVCQPSKAMDTLRLAFGVSERQ